MHTRTINRACFYVVHQCKTKLSKRKRRVTLSTKFLDKNSIFLNRKNRLLDHTMTSSVTLFYLRILFIKNPQDFQVTMQSYREKIISCRNEDSKTDKQCSSDIRIPTLAICEKIRLQNP